MAGLLKRQTQEQDIVLAGVFDQLEDGTCQQVFWVRPSIQGYALQFAELMAPYTSLIHLWNASLSSNQSGGHYPVLPSQSPADGWADIPAYLDILKRSSSNAKVLFEHRSDLVSDDALNQTYAWTQMLLS